MASNEALTTKSVVKGELEIASTTHDSWIDRQIKVASGKFTKIANRNFHSVSGHTEDVGSFGATYLTLEEYFPITSVEKVEYRGSVVNADEYELHNRAGMVRYKIGNWISTEVDDGVDPAKDYAVTYDAGWTTPAQSGTRNLPFDLEEAIVQYVVTKFAQRGRDETVASMAVGDGSIKWTEHDGERLPASFVETAKEYKRTVIR